MRTLTPNFTVVALKCGLTGANIAKMVNLWYKFVQKRYIPLNNFYTKFGAREGVPGPHPHDKFHSCGLKMWAYTTASEIAKIGIFLV